MSVRPRILFAGFVLLVCFTSGCGLRPGNRVLIPDGYVGWVRIFYRQATSPRLQKQAGSYIITVDETGTAHTSSPREAGYGNDEYFYVSSAGGRKKLKLQGMDDQQDDMVHHFTYQSAPTEVTLFFVGPREAVATTPRPSLVR